MKEYGFKTHGRLALQAVVVFWATAALGYAQTAAPKSQPAVSQPAPGTSNIYGTAPGGKLDLSDARIRFWQWQVSRDQIGRASCRERVSPRV